ncbi:MAG: VCBS repeat-containing protein [Acidobacteria bacterium]|nr:VCBS repeat-containing protein [Acidobacteriota bacterium]
MGKGFSTFKPIVTAVLIAFVVSGTAAYAQFNPVLEWAWTGSAVQPSALNVMNTPSVIDLNGDGTPDVVFGSTASNGGGLVEVGYLRALNGSDGSELFTVTDPNYLINTAASVATGDIDLDGSPEIIACDSTGSRLIAFEHDGAFKWRSPVLEAINWGAPAIADLDQDGTPEIIVGRQVLDNTGTVLWTGTGGRGSQSTVGPISLVSDVDLDGSPEIVAGNTVYDKDGSIEYQNPALPDGHNAVADFDADDQAEIVLVSGGTVRLLEHDLTVKWGPVAIPGGGGGGPPTIADYDADGEPEIGVAGAIRYAVFETDGSLKWAAVTQDNSSNRTGSSVFDFEGDGAAEVVYSDETKLWVYRGADGFVLFQTPLSSCTWHEYPLVADVDGDDNAELLAVANNNCGYGPQRGIYVYRDADNKWVKTRQLWNQHTYHITNINPNGTIPAVETNNWEVEGLNNFRLNEYGEFEGPPCSFEVQARAKLDKVQLTWEYSGGDSYNIYRSFVSGGPYSLIANTTSTYSTYLDTGLTVGTTYYYKIAEVVDGEEVCFSQEVEITPAARTR